LERERKEREDKEREEREMISNLVRKEREEKEREEREREERERKEREEIERIEKEREEKEREEIERENERKRLENEKKEKERREMEELERIRKEKIKKEEEERKNREKEEELERIRKEREKKEEEERKKREKELERIRKEEEERKIKEKEEELERIRKKKLKKEEEERLKKEKEEELERIRKEKLKKEEEERLKKEKEEELEKLNKEKLLKLKSEEEKNSFSDKNTSSIFNTSSSRKYKSILKSKKKKNHISPSKNKRPLPIDVVPEKTINTNRERMKRYSQIDFSNLPKTKTNLPNENEIKTFEGKQIIKCKDKQDLLNKINLNKDISDILYYYDEKTDDDLNDLLSPNDFFEYKGLKLIKVKNGEILHNTRKRMSLLNNANIKLKNSNNQRKKSGFHSGMFDKFFAGMNKTLRTGPDAEDKKTLAFTEIVPTEKKIEKKCKFHFIKETKGINKNKIKRNSVFIDSNQINKLRNNILNQGNEDSINNSLNPLELSDKKHKKIKSRQSVFSPNVNLHFNFETLDEKSDEKEDDKSPKELPENNNLNSNLLNSTNSKFKPMIQSFNESELGKSSNRVLLQPFELEEEIK